MTVASRMHRQDIKKYFKCCGPAILPVIHVLDKDQTARNVAIAVREGAPGIFLINHDFGVTEFLPIIQHVRLTFPSLWLGVNFLGVTGEDAFPVLAKLQSEGTGVDAYWADDARIDEKQDVGNQAQAQAIARTRSQCGWNGLYLGGTAFKKQRPVNEQDYEPSARIATAFMDVVTTSGKATGMATPSTKVDAFRRGAGDTALALASGVTPANIEQYADRVDIVLVATGIGKTGDFYNIDPVLLRRLLEKSRRPPITNRLPDPDREHRWYVALMAPRSRGEKYAWLDPSAAYINARSFNTMLDDLLEPFDADEIDVVAGFDAAGFVLGAAMATRLGKGFLTLRKGGKIPVEFDVVPMTNYSGQTQELEMRKPAFAPGTRVLLVDQWIETGGTMDAGIRLIERQQGIVAGIAAVCIEENAASQEMCRKFKTSRCILPGTNLQAQCNRKTLDSFQRFQPQDAFPETKERD